MARDRPRPQVAPSDRLNEREWDAWKTLSGDLDKWFKGDSFQRYPTREQIHALGPDAVLGGWKPAQPIIGPDTRVIAMGSCFAANFAEWLAANGYNQAFADPVRALLRNPFENVAVIAQQFRWAFGELDPQNLLWVGKDKQRIFATEEKRLIVRQLLSEADVLIVTLALSEVWYDTTTGEPVWRVASLKLHDPAKHAFKVMSFAETIEAFNQIERIRAAHLPRLKIVYTVSPLNHRPAHPAKGRGIEHPIPPEAARFQDRPADPTVSPGRARPPRSGSGAAHRPRCRSGVRCCAGRRSVPNRKSLPYRSTRRRRR